MDCYTSQYRKKVTFGTFFWHFEIDLHFVSSYLEAFPHVGLHAERILGFAENFQKLIVRQEKEAGKEQSFLLQIVV